MKLFCLPHAGGSASSYAGWKVELRPEITVVPIEAAGKGSRYDEPLYPDWETAVDDLYREIVKELHPGDRYAIFGHSMGSWLAYDILRTIIRKNMPQPEQMFFSGNTPPFMQPKEEAISHLSDAEFIQKILEMGDTPAEVFETGMLDFFLPPLRRDYELVEGYEHEFHDAGYGGVMNVCYGNKDCMSRSDMEAWQRYAHAAFGLKEFDGGHMYFKHSPEELLVSIRNALK